MTGSTNGQRGEWSVKWRMMCEGLDPLAPADSKPAGRHRCRRGPIISTTGNRQGLHLIEPGASSCPGDMAGARAALFRCRYVDVVIDGAGP
ncbi:hypothetical protein ACNKHL_07935 [Shigella flexneri]